MRRKTIEWQVCGTCNYDCSYCIQSKASRVGQPSNEEAERLLSFFEKLPGSWEVKMSGGEPFAAKAFLPVIVPGLVSRTAHRVSVLTNLSAPRSALERFASLTRGRLHVVSASLHLESVTAEDFADKAVFLKERIDERATLVCNSVVVPGQIDAAERAKAVLESRGLRYFPQLMKTKRGVFDYDEPDRKRLPLLTGDTPSPREANLAPSYRGRLCFSGVDYFVLTQAGEAWSCRTAKRFGEGHLGSALDGTFALRAAPARCTYDICPCTVPANRGMIEGVGAAS
jgi:organic radical activating enzyme